MLLKHLDCVFINYFQGKIGSYKKINTDHEIRCLDVKPIYGIIMTRGGTRSVIES
jgi:hypothetical protein